MEKLLQHIMPSDVTEGRVGSIELNIFLAQLMGLPLTGLRPETQKERWGSLVLSIFVLPGLFCYVLMELYDLLLNWNDLDVMTQNMVMSLTHVGYWFKVFNTYYYYERIKCIVGKLRKLTKTNVVTDKQRRTFYRMEIVNKLVCLMYFNLVVFSAVMAFLMILIAPDGFAGERFPFRVKVPNVLTPSIQNLYMGLSLLWISCGVTTIDNVNVLFMNHICMHLKILNLAFDGFALESSSIGDPHTWIVSIVKYHCELIVLRQEMEKIYRLPIMFQFVSSLITVAMTVFQTIVGDSSNSSLLMYFLLSGVICQLFLYCWFGNEVYEQSKTLSTSAFGCDWFKFDMKLKRSLLIFMINADRPFLFTAGGFMGLTLTSFANILGKSYSIVAVLRQMYSRIMKL